MVELAGGGSCSTGGPPSPPPGLAWWLHPLPPPRLAGPQICNREKGRRVALRRMRDQVSQEAKGGEMVRGGQKPRCGNLDGPGHLTHSLYSWGPGRGNESRRRRTARTTHHVCLPPPPPPPPNHISLPQGGSDLRCEALLLHLHCMLYRKRVTPNATHLAPRSHIHTWVAKRFFGEARVFLACWRILR